MEQTTNIPEGLVVESQATNHQSHENGWLYDQGQQSYRLGLKVERSLHHEKSAYQSLEILQSNFFGKVFTLDNAIMFTEREEFIYHEMVTHVPLLSHPNPESVLIIGGGDAGCLREVLKHPCVKRVVQCDIDERVTRVCEQWFNWVTPAIREPRSEVLFADGVQYLDDHEDAFDVIIIDSTDPVGPAVGLFLEEFYNKVATALKPGGIMVAQTESPFWNAKMVGAIYEQLRHSFTSVASFLGWVPCYPSGCWSWAFASNDQKHHDIVDKERATNIEKTTKYYNSQIHQAAFALPNFVTQVQAGSDPLAL